MIKRTTTDYIVIHTAAWPGDPSIEDVRRVHVEENGWSDVGYHYLIRKDGHIESGRDEALQGAHCRAGNMNPRSIGICCSGHGDMEPFTGDQFMALAELVNGLRKEYNIPVDHVIGHREAGAAKTCPGTKVDMDVVRGYIAADGNYILPNTQVGTDPSTVQVPNDKDDNGLSDEFEEPVTGAEPVDHSKGGPPKKGFWTWMRETLAGENTAGKIGARLKDLLKDWLPAGPLIDRMTDRVGDEFKSKKKRTDMISNDPKTTVAGFILILVGLAGVIFGVDVTSLDIAVIIEQAGPYVLEILAGLGLLSARDNRRKDER